MNVYQKLNEARERFHQSPLKKSGFNKFAGYSYFELGDFVVPALQIFKEVGLTSVITFKHDEASMQIVNTDKPDEVITITTPMSEAHLKGCHPVQNLGAVETYLRRYLWVAALEVVEHDSLDATSKKTDEPKEEEGEEKPKKKVVAKRYEEPDTKSELFIESLIKWGEEAKSQAELTDLWKQNQGAIDDLKNGKPELFKKLQARFGELKSNFQ